MHRPCSLLIVAEIKLEDRQKERRAVGNRPLHNPHVSSCHVLTDLEHSVTSFLQFFPRFFWQLELNKIILLFVSFYFADVT
jgi:hypothetical protein